MLAVRRKDHFTSLMTFVEAAQSFLEHREDDGNLIPDFWSPLLATVRNPSFFTPLHITTPFPNTQYYSVRVTTEQGTLQLQPAVNPSPEAQQLIVRTTEQPLTKLQPYLLQEFAAYEALGGQANDLLYPIGFAPLSSATLTVFLGSDLVTLETRLATDSECPLAVKVSIAGVLIAVLSEAHHDEIKGFDLRPSTVLIQEGVDDGVALFGFVGGLEALQTHPDAKQLKWDMSFAAPELKPGVKPTLNPPTTSSDVYAMSCLLEWLLRSSPDDENQELNDVVKSLLSPAKQRIPRGRISSDKLNTNFIDIQSQLLEFGKDFGSNDKSSSPITQSIPVPPPVQTAPQAPQAPQTPPTPTPTPTQAPTHHPSAGPGTNPSPLPSLRERIRAVSTPIQPNPGSPTIYKVPQVIMGEEKGTGGKTQTQGEPVMIRAIAVGPRAELQRTEIRILVLGQTGAGKTTFLNGIVNWLYGIQWNDKFRFKIITEEDEGSTPGAKRNQSISQTDHVTSYTFSWQSEFPIQHTVTIIDTPGFGDTRGIQRDDETVAKLHQLFKGQGRCGLDSLDAVAFVVQSSLARLDHAQRYIFDSVLKMFGKDIVDNIIIVATFADAGDPQVLHAIKEDQIPDKNICKFNNSALFAPVGGIGGQLNQFFWDIGTENYRLFFNAVQQLQPRSLLLTKQVLDERKKLQATIDGLCTVVREGVAKMNEIEEEIRIIDQYRREIEANRNFTTRVKIQKSKKIDLTPGQYVTNCQVCNMTCHFPCYIPRDEDKSGCAAMRNGYCTVCPQKCAWDIHHNMQWRWELYEVEESRTLQELKDKYGDASSKKQTREKMLASAEQQYIDIWDRTERQVESARNCLNLLRQIAARAAPLSEVDYIELQIEGEKSRAQLGWQQRVGFLNETLERSKLLKAIAEGNEASVMPSARTPSGTHSVESQTFFQSLLSKLRRRP